MRTYFASRISEPNLRNVMKVTTALASGAGSKCHTKHDGVFCEGRPIDMSTDFHALRVEANEWLHPDDDPGHGWRLDHPIGKLCIFQRHLFEQRQLSARANNLAAAGGTEEAPAKGDNNLAAPAAAAAAATATAAAAAATTNVAAKAPVKPARPKVR